jgi:phosphohistidine phosphatase
MKTLTLLRHAKSEAESPGGGDFERSLNDRGRADARRMGEEIRRLQLRFDLVLASPARRVVETMEQVGELSSRYDSRIYNASTGQLLEIIRSTDDGIDSLLIVGHNPGIEELAAQLSAVEIEKFPTGALAEIKLSVDHWRDVKGGTEQLTRFVKPKDLSSS